MPSVILHMLLLTAPADRTHPEALPWVCCSAACILCGGICWVSALATKPPNVSWFDGNLWLKLPPQGKRLRKRGFLFYFGALAFFAIAFAVTRI
jgi:hypothetical protein